MFENKLERIFNKKGIANTEKPGINISAATKPTMRTIGRTFTHQGNKPSIEVVLAGTLEGGSVAGVVGLVGVDGRVTTGGFGFGKGLGCELVLFILSI